MPKTKKTKKVDKLEKIAKDRLDEKKVDAGLQAIYGEEKSDLNTLDQGRNPMMKLLLRIVIVLALFSVLGWTAFIAYQTIQPNNDITAFDLDIISPDEITSGDISTLTFKYYYPNDLAGLSIDVNLPKSFILRDTSTPPTDEDELIWNLGSQDKGQSGEIVLTGKWLAEVPSENSVQAFARYKPLSVNAELEEVSSKRIRTTKSVAEVSYSGPDEVTAGETVELSFEVENTAEEPLPTSELRLELPQNFFLQRSEPATTEEGVWLIDTVQPGEIYEIVVNGAFSSETSDLEELTYNLHFKHEEEDLTQAEEILYFDVIASDLQSSLLINGQPDLVIVEPGDDLETSIILENGLDSTISNTSVLLDFRAENRMPVIWSSAELNGARLTADGILWSSELIGDLVSGATEVLRASFPVESSLSENDTDSMTVTARTFISGREIRSRRIQILIGTEPKINTSTSDAGLTYTLNSGVSGLADIRLEFEIDDSKFKPEVSIGKINNFAGTLVWSIESMDSGKSASLIFPDSVNIESTDFSAKYPQTLTPAPLD